MMPSTPEQAPAFLSDCEAVEPGTVALLFQIFGDVLIPLDAVRSRYFRNLSAEVFRRALRDYRIPLPITTLDQSSKAQGYVCIYHLAALIETGALEAMRDYPSEPQTQRMRRAVPITDFREAATAAAR